MLDFLIANWGTLLIGTLVLAALLGAIVMMARDKKQGGSSCRCGGCSGCGGGGACHGHAHPTKK